MALSNCPFPFCKPQDRTQRASKLFQKSCREKAGNFSSNLWLWKMKSRHFKGGKRSRASCCVDIHFWNGNLFPEAGVDLVQWLDRSSFGSPWGKFMYRKLWRRKEYEGIFSSEFGPKTHWKTCFWSGPYGKLGFFPYSRDKLGSWTIAGQTQTWVSNHYSFPAPEVRYHGLVLPVC